MICPTLRKQGVSIRDVEHAELCLECAAAKCYYDERPEIIAPSRRRITNLADAKPGASTLLVRTGHGEIWTVPLGR